MLAAAPSSLLRFLLLLLLHTVGRTHGTADAAAQSGSARQLLVDEIVARAGLAEDPSIGDWDMKPAPNTTIYYVSASDGDDSTGKGYRPADPAVGPDPLLPAGKVSAFKTIAAAISKTAVFQPDWVLLKRGDSWVDGKDGTQFPVHPKTGLSAAAPTFLGAYGAGCGKPRLMTGTSDAINVCCHGFAYNAFDGLEIYAHTRDPATVGVTKLGVTHGSSGFMFNGPPPQPQVPPSPEPAPMLCRDAPGQNSTNNKCGVYPGVPTPANT